MKVRIAYLDEPPFYWTGPDGSATGADIELADVVLRAGGQRSAPVGAFSFAGRKRLAMDLDQEPRVAFVMLPGPASHPRHGLASRQFG